MGTVILAVVVSVLTTFLLVLFYLRRFFSIEYSSGEKIPVSASKITVDKEKKEEILKEIRDMNKGLSEKLDSILNAHNRTEEIIKNVYKDVREIKEVSIYSKTCVEENSGDGSKDINENHNQNYNQEVQEEKIELPNYTEILDFKSRYILPYKDLFTTEELKLIDKVLDILDKEGSCSSVVSYQKDDETDHLKNWKQGGTVTTYDIVQKTTLREHTLNVVEELINLIKKKKGKLWKTHYPKAVISALLHDIGKIPNFRKNKLYNKGMHPKVSGEVARVLMQDLGFNEDYIDEIVNIVENHHSIKKGEFSELLKEADHSARKKEVVKYGENIIDATMELQYDEKKNEFGREFLNIFIEKLFPYINTKKLFKGKRFVNAFLYNGYIYFDMEVILHELVNDKHIKLPYFFYKEDLESKEKAFVAIANTLRKYNYLSEDHRPPYFSSSYRISLKDGKTYSQRRTAVRSKILELINKEEHEIPSPDKSFQVSEVRIKTESKK